MDLTFDLRDIDTVNLIASFEEEALALAMVSEAVARHGVGDATGLALISEDGRGRSCLLAEGEALLERAEAIPMVLPVTGG